MGKKGHFVQSRTARRSHGSLVWNATAIIAAAYVAMCLVVALWRLAYPFELEWMEGGAVDHVARILHGQPLYVRPSIDFVPYIYTPLYYYACAPLAKLIGLGFLPLRLVSLLSSLGCFALLFHWVRKETGNWRLGLIAAGIYAASFRLCGAWFDIARADSLYVLLMIAGGYVLRFARDPKKLALAAILLWLAFLTKQTAQFVCIPLIVYALVQHRMKGLWFAGTLMGLVAISVFLLNWLHDGWFFYYIFHLPGLHKLDPSQLGSFWLNDVGKHFAPVMLVSIVTVISMWRAGRRSDWLFFLMLGCGCVAASWSNRVFTGGYDNALMPTMAALAIGSTIIVSNLTLRSGRRSLIVDGLIPLVLIAQFALLWYNPITQIPSRGTEEAGQTIIDAISRFPGEVYMPYHGFIPTLAGKRTYAHRMPIKDVIQYDTAMEREINGQLDSAFATHRFSLIILDSPWQWNALQESYEGYRGMPEAVMSFWPVTGMPTRPRFWYVPR